MRASRALRICVFCGASTGFSPTIAASAATLGRLIAQREHHLIYGAGGIGLMGAVAVASTQAGGNVTGVIPAFLRRRERDDVLPEQELIITTDLCERKRHMLSQADCYLVLPGGYGTLDELLEVISMAALGLHSKPIVLINVDGVWDPFLLMTETLLDRGFAKSGLGEIFHVVTTPESALALVEQELAGHLEVS